MPITAPTSFQRPDLGMAYHEYDYESESLGFVAQRILPVFPTAIAGGNFTVIPREELMKDVSTKRAPGSGATRDTAKIEQKQFLCEEHVAEEPIDSRQRAVYAYSFDYEMVVSKRAASKLWRSMEIACAAAIFNSTTWAGASLTTAVSVPWSTFATAKPIQDVHRALQSLRASCGSLKGARLAVIMSYAVFLFLQDVVEIVDRLKYSGIDDPKKVTLQALAAIFNVDEVIVAENMRNTANSGQSPVLGEIWSRDMVMVAKLARDNDRDLSASCLGRTFVFTGEHGEGFAASAGMAPTGLVIDMYREEQTKSDIIRAAMDYDQMVIDANCGHLLTNINGGTA